MRPLAAPVAAGADGAGAEAEVYGAGADDAGGGAAVPVGPQVVLLPTGYGAGAGALDQAALL